MHVFGQDHPGVDMKGIVSLCKSNRMAKQIDMADKQIAGTVTQVYREEIGRSSDTGAPVVGHGSS
ncbi:hypothetical protein D3C78_1594180 [compost metagenome]